MMSWHLRRWLYLGFDLVVENALPVPVANVIGSGRFVPAKGLGEKRDGLVQMLDRQVLDVHSIKANAALVRFVKAGDQSDEGRLAGAVLSHQCYHLTGLYLQGDAGQCRRA